MNKSNWFNSGKCDRCNEKSIVFGMSFFNTDMICEDCIAEEKSHSMYKKAREEELKEVKKGNLNFKGIGLPKELRR